MRKKLKEEIKNCFSELNDIVPDEGLAPFKRLNRLFVDMRKDMSALSKDRESAIHEKETATARRLESDRELAKMSKELDGVSREYRASEKRVRHSDRHPLLKRVLQDNAIKCIVDRMLSADTHRSYQQPDNVDVSDEIRDRVNKEPSLECLVGLLIIDALAVHGTKKIRRVDGRTSLFRKTYPEIDIVVSVYDHPDVELHVFAQTQREVNADHRLTAAFQECGVLIYSELHGTDL